MASIERRSVQRSVRCILSRDERLSYGDQLGTSTQLHAQAVEHKKEVSNQLTAEVKKHANEVSRLGTLLANGYEYRIVDCVLRIDRISGKATTTVPDTGEIIEDRNLTADEKQGKLGFDSESFIEEGRSLVEELQDAIDKEPGSGADIEVVSVELAPEDTGEERVDVEELLDDLKADIDQDAEEATDAEAKPEDQQ